MTTLATLINNWSERDSRYSTRKKGGILQPLTEDEISSIRAYRTFEVGDLPENDQRLGLVTVSRWTPPVTMR